MTNAKPNSLDQSLAELHAKLAGAHRLDESSRKLLHDVLQDIERLLREPRQTRRAPQLGAARRLETLAVGFDADHPALAASLREFIDLLGRAGL
ncbi:MAG: DUF4404 family protein [Steroidobacteraceae bacterium]|jgi:hypothetical protein